MATFLVDIQGYSSSTAWLSASFTGGDPEYSNRRRCKIEVKYDSTVVGTYGVLDNGEYVGESSVFDAEFGSFSASTTYSYTCTLQYKTGSTWYDSSYTDTGTFTTEDPEPTYRVSLTFATNGGTGGPGTKTYNEGDTGVTRSGDYLSFKLPSNTPTPPTGKRFDYWLYNGNHYAPDTAYWWYSLGGQSFTLTAQWKDVSTGYKAYICNGTTWEPYTAYICNGTSWEPYTPKIYNGGWE